MARDLRTFLEGLGRGPGRLIRVTQPVDPRFEVSAVEKTASAGAQTRGDGGPALLFENLVGFPGVFLASNFLGARQRMASLLDCPPDQLMETYLDKKNRAIAPVVARTAPCQEVVHSGPDLDLRRIIPVPTYHERDAGPFVTAGVCLAGRSMGIHRLMVKGPKRLGIFLANPPLSDYLADAEAKGEPLEIAVAIGVDPALMLASVVKANPDGPGKIEIAGGVAGEPVELVRALTVEVMVPARAEFIIEGRILPGVREPEGPFGENTGYYFENISPVLEVTAITHRTEPIYYSIQPWGAECDQLLTVAAGSESLGRLRQVQPKVAGLELVPGTCTFSAVLSVRGASRSEVKEVIRTYLEIDRRAKQVIVVDDDVNIQDPREVSWAVATRCQPDRDVLIVSDLAGYVIDPSAVGGKTSKIGIDATRSPGPEHDKIRVPEGAMTRAREILDHS